MSRPRSESTPLAAFPTGAKSETRVSLDTYGGRTFANLRDWYQSRDGTWKPTRRGVTINVADLPALAEAVSRAIERAGDL